MWFVQEHASSKFTLPEDPHLTHEQHLIKLQQIQEMKEQQRKREQGEL
jgi:hypothetical protein